MTAENIFTIELPPPPKCAVPECTDTKLKGRGLCATHYSAEWATGNHVFRPKREEVELFQVRCFLYEEDVATLDAFAKTRGLSRSELIREVMHALVRSL